MKTQKEALFVIEPRVIRKNYKLNFDWPSTIYLKVEQKKNIKIEQLKNK